MATGKNWLYEAGRVWSVLVDAAKRPGALLFYKDIANAIDTNPLSVRLALDPIQNFCMREDLPPLTAMVVQKTTGRPGPGFIAWDIRDIATAHARVRAFDWSVVPNPFALLAPTDTIDSLAKELVERPDAPTTVYSKVPSRGVAQQVFRAALLIAYEGRCAFCDLSFEAALEAAHIRPWHRCTLLEKMDPANGVLLCATHHKLFDAALLTFDSEYQIIYYDAEAAEWRYTDADRVASTVLHRKQMRLPKLPRLRPNVSLLAQRHEVEEWGDLDDY